MNYNQHILIALPDMTDERFKQAVILVCEDNEEGTMGLVINHPIELDMNDVFTELELNTPAIIPCSLSNGGPLGNNHGFVIHNNNDQFQSSKILSKNLTLTTSKDLLKKISENEFDNKWQLILGYSAWSKGQLDNEILNNSWLTCPIDTDLIFNTPVKNQWEKALSLIGIKDFRNISGEFGHA